MDVRSALKEAIGRLRAAQVPSHTLAAELLLMHARGCDRTWLYSHPEERLDPLVAEKYFSLVARRADGEPAQYLTGKQDFWGLEFEVTPAVLIPRPETEHVIEVALTRLGARGIKNRLDTGAPNTRLRVADVGTGSGCIAVALARVLPDAEIFATDISAAALDVAQRNATRHGVSDRIHFFECDLLGAFLGFDSLPVGVRHGMPELSSKQAPFDLIVSNPPYVARDEAAQLPREVRRHEPDVALFGGPTGARIYKRLIEQAGTLLRPGGLLVLELGYNSRERVNALFNAQRGWTNISITNDLAGIPRVLAGERGRQQLSRV